MHAMPVCDEIREKHIINTKASGSPAKEKLLRTLMLLSKEAQASCFNIYLIGMPYSGKSTLLQKLSEASKKECADMDSIIEGQAGVSIYELFQTEGEAGFRTAETELLRFLAGEGSLIVATGGGIIKSEENLRLMKNSGYTVLCDRPLNSIRSEYELDENKSRPLVQSTEELEILYFERFKAYREAADLIINPERPNAVSNILSFMHDKGLV